MTEDNIVIAISLSRSSLSRPEILEFLETMHFSVTVGPPDDPE
jgi:hypothetical protein